MREMCLGEIFLSGVKVWKRATHNTCTCIYNVHVHFVCVHRNIYMYMYIHVHVHVHISGGRALTA